MLFLIQLRLADPASERIDQQVGFLLTLAQVQGATGTSTFRIESDFQALIDIGLNVSAIFKAEGNLFAFPTTNQCRRTKVFATFTIICDDEADAAGLTANHGVAPGMIEEGMGLAHLDCEAAGIQVTHIGDDQNAGHADNG